MDNNQPQHKQTEKYLDYAGTGELVYNERYLRRYNQDLVSLFSRSLNKITLEKTVVEFGAGIGTLAQIWYQKNHQKPICIEIDPKQQNIIKGRGFSCVSTLDELTSPVAGIYTSNVLEHIEDDQAILQALFAHLEIEGILVVYVPAFMCLYSPLDQSIGHYRRYGKNELENKLKKAGFTIVRSHYADSIGWLAWFITRWTYRPNMSEASRAKQLLLYDRFIRPFSHFIDRLGFKYLFGKNIFVVAKKVSRTQVENLLDPDSPKQT
jgi:2-polyprenyl-3-methyl-5-hydroxy-6-metoxy-1,4-benzoquinol methylase